MKQIISQITLQLTSVYPADEAEELAWWVVEETTGMSRTQLLCGCKDTTFSANMQTIIDRLLHFEPVQYIFGHTLWNGLDLKVTPATLIPRPETADLVRRINTRMANDQMVHVLDVGTGSGCIAIALQKAHPEWQVSGIDISPEAISVARENALRNQVEVNFQVADIFSDKIEGSYDLVVSNPPYICEREKKDMRPNVLDFEPSGALFVPDSDPLKFYRRIAGLSASLFQSASAHGRFLFFEINEAYAAEVSALLASLGYSDIQITKDIYGKDRIIECRMA